MHPHRIVIFRGLFGKQFSTGMDVLADKLRSLGHTVSIHSWLSRRSVQKELIENKPSLPVVCVGHSLGGNAANYLAAALNAAGIKVTYTATVDATAPIPAVSKADNFRSSDFRDKAVKGATELRFDELSHIQIDKDPRVHQRIISQINKDTRVHLRVTLQIE